MLLARCTSTLQWLLANQLSKSFTFYQIIENWLDFQVREKVISNIYFLYDKNFDVQMAINFSFLLTMIVVFGFLFQGEWNLILYRIIWSLCGVVEKRAEFDQFLFTKVDYYLVGYFNKRRIYTVIFLIFLFWFLNLARFVYFFVKFGTSLLYGRLKRG